MNSPFSTDFGARPIIVLGANHSGTRVLVEILRALGSDGGQCNNEWREAEVFRQAHRLLTQSQSTEEWSERIFKPERLRFLQPDERRSEEIVRMLRDRVPAEFPSYRSRPWHWKCPTSAFFLDFWKEVYPEAYYVHLHRDPLDVASSLITRKQFYTIRSALKFCEEVDSVIRSAHLPRYLRLSYATLVQNLQQLVDFAPGLDAAALPAASALVRVPSRSWRTSRSIKHNAWVYLTHARVTLARRLSQS